MQRHLLAPPSITDALLSIPDRSHCPFPMAVREEIFLGAFELFLGVFVVWGYKVE